MLKRRSFDLPPIPEPEAREAGGIFIDIISDLQARHPAYVTRESGWSFLILDIQNEDTVMNADLGLGGPDGFIEFCEGGYNRDIDSPTICRYGKDNKPFVRRNDCDDPLSRSDLRGRNEDISFLEGLSLIGSLISVRALEISLGINRQCVGVDEVNHLGSLLLNGVPRHLDE